MIRVLQGDCRDILPTLEANSVHTVITSPPYYALRSYLDAEHPDKHREIGSEATPDEYIHTMVGVFREVRRVLRDDGTVFCNMGDGYSDKQLLMMPARLALALQADGWCKAGTSERGCCAQCGTPWVREIERSVAFTSGSGRAGNVPEGKYQGSAQALSGDYDIRMGPSVQTTTTGWSPGCTCGAATVPCRVLDPFAGAGTSLLVADRLQRDGIAIELNASYVAMLRSRITNDAPLFVEMAAD